MAEWLRLSCDGCGAVGPCNFGTNGAPITRGAPHLVSTDPQRCPSVVVCRASRTDCSRGKGGPQSLLGTRERENRCPQRPQSQHDLRGHGRQAPVHLVHHLGIITPSGAKNESAVRQHANPSPTVPGRAYRKVAAYNSSVIYSCTGSAVSLVCVVIDIA
jgi:hypothetical protein